MHYTALWLYIETQYVDVRKEMRYSLPNDSLFNIHNFQMTQTMSIQKITIHVYFTSSSN